MRVTVCELSAAPGSLPGEWEALVRHTRAEASDLVLLPEMPFHPWIAATRDVDPGAWEQAVEAHARWIPRLAELAPAVVIGTRPVVRDGRRLNEAFISTGVDGAPARAHAKRHLPDEDGFWEASWYGRGDEEFGPYRVAGADLGFLICTELWFPERARELGRRGAHLIACPRGTPAATLDKWLAGGRTAAVLAGAYCLSSNLRGRCGGVRFAGVGWIVEPEEGEVLGVTSEGRPFLTLEIDLRAAEAAKLTYPRYVE